MIRRALVVELLVRFGFDSLCKRLYKPGLTDARLPRNQHCRAMSRFRLPPPPQYELQLPRTPDYRRKSLRAKRVKTTFLAAFSTNLPCNSRRIAVRQDIRSNALV